MINRLLWFAVWIILSKNTLYKLNWVTLNRSNFGDLNVCSMFIYHREMVVLNLIIVLMIETIGNGLLALLIIYERFIEDPQKRTVNNQLISHLCGWLIINNLIGAPIVMYGIRVSGVGKSFLLINLNANLVYTLIFNRDKYI